MNQRIQLEERKLLLTQRRLEAVRMLTYLFEKMKTDEEYAEVKMLEVEIERRIGHTFKGQILLWLYSRYCNILVFITYELYKFKYNKLPLIKCIVEIFLAFKFRFKAIL